MSLTNPKTAVNEDFLKDFYDKIKPFLAPKTYAGFTPIGTIISVFGETAPANYLICDGATYNVADYPELCAHLWNLTTNSQYKVSGDSTKFKVPDLRGEFLRGTGTNGHADQGNGLGVGVHGDATWHPTMGVQDISTTPRVNFRIDTSRNDGFPSYVDASMHKGTGTIKNARYSAELSLNDTGETDNYFASRPTNTSVLFCIATKNIYLDPKNDYSTEEKVIGTWIDGKTLYQRTWNINTSEIPLDTTTIIITKSDYDMSEIISISGMAYQNTAGYNYPLNYNNNAVAIMVWERQGTNIAYKLIAQSDLRMTKIIVTVQYTKTT